MLARPVPGLAAFLQAHSQASLQMFLQKLCSICFVNDQHWPAAEIGRHEAPPAQSPVDKQGQQRSRCAILKQASRQACLSGSLIRKRQLGLPGAALRPLFVWLVWFVVNNKFHG
jgi:hypothetical protein